MKYILKCVTLENNFHGSEVYTESSDDLEYLKDIAIKKAKTGLIANLYECKSHWNEGLHEYWRVDVAKRSGLFSDSDLININSNIIYI